jgi:hypothetical protein
MTDTKTADANGQSGVAPAKSGSSHRSDFKDNVAEMAARAHEISLEAGTRVAGAMKDLITTAAGLAGFAVESARDLVQFMVRRGQMTQEEADKLMKDVEAAQPKRKPQPAPPSGSLRRPGASGAAPHTSPPAATPGRPARPPKSGAPSAGAGRGVARSSAAGKTRAVPATTKPRKAPAATAERSKAPTAKPGRATAAKPPRAPAAVASKARRVKASRAPATSAGKAPARAAASKAKKGAKKR